MEISFEPFPKYETINVIWLYLIDEKGSWKWDGSEWEFLDDAARTSGDSSGNQAPDGASDPNRSN